MEKKLDRGDVICGYSAKKIRNFLGYGRDGAFSRQDIVEAEHFTDVAMKHFGDNAEVVAAELARRGWIVRGKNDGNANEYFVPKGAAVVALTQLGKQSRIVLLRKRISRADGETIVTELIRRAKEIDARDELIYGISELRLYGSMLDSKADTVGDVDIAFEIYRRKLPTGIIWTDWNFARADASGRTLSFHQRLCYGSTEVESLLKSRVQRLSLQRMDSFHRMKPRPKFKVIFKTERKLTPRQGATERVEIR